MFRLNLISAAAVIVVLATGARAADMPVLYEPEPVEYKSWYLRGDIGASHQISDDIDSPHFDDMATAGDDLFLYDTNWAASWFISGGIGYRVNDWFRVDVTGEYRFSSDLDASDAYDTAIGGVGLDGTNEYDGDKQEAVFLFNAYFDLPSYGKMTPYVGAGVGASWIKLSDFTDYDAFNDNLGLSDDVSSWNFAWALYAGLSFEITEQLTFDVGYRYLHLGDIETDDLLAPDGDNDTNNPFNFDNIASHDIKIGARYAFY